MWQENRVYRNSAGTGAAFVDAVDFVDNIEQIILLIDTFGFAEKQITAFYQAKMKSCQYLGLQLRL